MNFTKRTLAIAILTALITATPHISIAKSTSQETHIDNEQQLKAHPITRPKIQLAILLDTSSSMDGLIDQTRNQLWQVVNELSTTTQNGIRPILEVALFEYGNDNNPSKKGFIRRINQFTDELDKVSEGLFSLTTNGGSEFCGFVIQEAIQSLQWSKSNNDIKTIFIAGNEPFTQGPINYKKALKLAQKYGIAVNTIHAGNHQEGIDTGWQSGALLANGTYMSIDADQHVVHIPSPHDKKIAALNSELNETYIPFGAEGKKSKYRQEEQDSLSDNISPALLVKRIKSKSSSFYKNSTWDLVDAVEDGNVTEEALRTMPKEALPEEMKKLSTTERKQYIDDKLQERTRIKTEIHTLVKQRDAFVAEKKQEQKNQGTAKPSMGDALSKAVRKHAEEKEFIFE